MLNMRNFAFAILIIASLSALTLAQQSTPKSAVESFYSFDRSHSQVFNRQNVDARRRWFSPELYGLFRTELRREAAYLKSNPYDKPYFGDGMPFQPYDEICRAGMLQLRRSIVVRQEFRRGDRAAATAKFVYPRACKDGGEPIVYTIGLRRKNGRWAIDDVNYGEDTSLKQRLRREVY